MSDDLIKRLRGDLPDKKVESHWITDYTAVEMQNREAADRIEAQAAEIEYWKAEARSVRKELKSEQKRADNAMDNYDAGVRRIEAQAAEIERLRDIVAIMHTAFAAYADSPAKQEAITLAGKAEQ